MFTVTVFEYDNDKIRPIFIVYSLALNHSFPAEYDSDYICYYTYMQSFCLGVEVSVEKNQTYACSDILMKKSIFKLLILL